MSSIFFVYYIYYPNFFYISLDIFPFVLYFLPMKILIFKQLIEQLYQRNGGEWTKAHGQDCLLLVIESALALGSEFFSVEDFTPLRDIEKIVNYLIGQGAVFVLPDIQEEKNVSF